MGGDRRIRSAVAAPDDPPVGPSRRVLFIDDDPDFLAATRRMLRSLKGTWHMSFAGGGAEGLLLLAETNYDAVVCDMMMPLIDGAECLKLVRERHPAVIRVVLSGAADLQARLRVVPVAHQFLTKPTNVNVVHELIERSCEVRDLLANQVLLDVVGELSALPLVPSTYTSLTSILSKPTTTVSQVAELVATDVAMSAKVLQLVNSAFFGVPRRISDIQHAVAYLGMPMIRHLVLTLEVFSWPKTLKRSVFSIDAERNHALLTGSIARKVVGDRQLGDDAFIAGVLHDIGMLVLASRMPERFAECLSLASQQDLPVEVVERDKFGVSHAEIGGYLLSLWGLPHPVVEAVAFHHSPRQVKHTRFDVLSAVHVANGLAGRVSGAPERVRELDMEYLRDLGVQDRLPGWRAIAKAEQEDK